MGYSGIRPLFDDGSSEGARVTRDYSLDFDTQGAPVLSIFGGKLTTYRRLAEQVLYRLNSFFPLPGHRGPLRRRYQAEICRTENFQRYWVSFEPNSPALH